MEPAAIFGSFRHTLKIGADMPTHLLTAQIHFYILSASPDAAMPEQVFLLRAVPAHRQSRQGGLQSAEQPGIAVGTAPQHQSVASCFCKHPLSVSYCQDITVTDDRYFYSRFDSGDNLPVCPAIIKLFPCPAVYCYAATPAFSASTAISSALICSESQPARNFTVTGTDTASVIRARIS
mgnify:CR=1 FL=1